MLVVVNFTQQVQTYTIDGADGAWHDFRSDRVVNGNPFAVKGCGVFVGTSAVKGADLPTYDETLALIDKLEYERTHRGSLLFDRWDQIKFTHSQSDFDVAWKLFDGVTDNYAVRLFPRDEMFFEADLTKVKTTFAKLVIHGYNIANMVMKIKVSDKLITPEIVEFITEENVTTLILKEAVTPDALRLEFCNDIPTESKDKVEMYELEFF